MCGCWFTLAQNDLMDLMVTLFDKWNLEEKMITMVWNGHHLHSNLPIDQFHMNPCFYHRESVFHFQRKSLQVVISARKLGHLSICRNQHHLEAKENYLYLQPYSQINNSPSGSFVIVAMKFVLISQDSRAFTIGPRGLETVWSGYRTISVPGVYTTS